MTNPTPGPALPEEEAVGIAVLLGREIKMKRMTPDQLLAADMMARRLQRLFLVHREEGNFKNQEEWEKFLNGTRRLLDWVSGQFYSQDDLEWFEEKMLTKELTLQDIGPLFAAMGMPDEEKPKPDNRKARRAK